MRLIDYVFIYVISMIKKMNFTNKIVIPSERSTDLKGGKVQYAEPSESTEIPRDRVFCWGSQLLLNLNNNNQHKSAFKCMLINSVNYGKRVYF